MQSVKVMAYRKDGMGAFFKTFTMPEEYKRECQHTDYCDTFFYPIKMHFGSGEHE